MSSHKINRFKTNLIIFSIVTIGLCFLSIYLFTFPSVFEKFNLSGKGQIGDTIGGITAPIIGIFGTILLYLSFTEQRIASSEEKLWNKKRLNSEILNYYLSDIKVEYQNLQVNEKKGMYALFEIATNVNDFSDFKNIDPFLSLLYSIKSFIERVESENVLLLDTDKEFFESTIKNFYKFKIKKSLISILEKVKRANEVELKTEIKELKDYLDEYLIEKPTHK